MQSPLRQMVCRHQPQMISIPGRYGNDFEPVESRIFCRTCRWLNLMTSSISISGKNRRSGGSTFLKVDSSGTTHGADISNDDDDDGHETNQRMLSNVTMLNYYDFHHNTRNSVATTATNACSLRLPNALLASFPTTKNQHHRT